MSYEKLMKSINQQQIIAAVRFNECVEDGQGHDVSAALMSELTGLGLVICSDQGHEQTDLMIEVKEVLKLAENIVSSGGTLTDYGHIFETPVADIDMKLVMDKKFSEGHGVLQINPNVPDKVIALAVRSALKSANGKSFSIVPSMGGLQDQMSDVVFDPKCDVELHEETKVAIVDLQLDAAKKQAVIDAWKAEAALLIIKQCCYSLSDAMQFAEAAFENIAGDIESETPQDCVDAEIDAARESL
jgi:hypothetical protein